MCRPERYERFSFCCDATEVGSRSCGGSDAFCSDKALSISMRPFTCPYSYGYCGASSSLLEMHPTRRNSLKVEISNYLFKDGETCYYIFYVPNSSLDMENMRYFYDIELTNVTNVDIYINNGTSFTTANDPIQVSFRSGYRF